MIWLMSYKDWLGVKGWGHSGWVSHSFSVSNQSSVSSYFDPDHDQSWWGTSTELEFSQVVLKIPGSLMNLSYRGKFQYLYIDSVLLSCFIKNIFFLTPVDSGRSMYSRSMYYWRTGNHCFFLSLKPVQVIDLLIQRNRGNFFLGYCIKFEVIKEPILICGTTHRTSGRHRVTATRWQCMLQFGQIMVTVEKSQY